MPVPDGIDPTEAVCIPLAYLTACQMLTRCRHLPPGATILVIGASGTVGTGLLDLARHLGRKAIGTWRAFRRAFACLASGGLLVGYGSQTMAVGREGIVSAALGLARPKLWNTLSLLLSGRRALLYSITARRSIDSEEFKADMAALFKLLREGAIHPVVIERLS